MVTKVEVLKEMWHLESQVGDAFWHFGYSSAKLHQLAGAVQRLEQPGEATHSWEEARMMQPRRLCEALNGNSSCAALMKLSLERLVLTWGLNQALGVWVIWKG